MNVMLPRPLLSLLLLLGVTAGATAAPAAEPPRVLLWGSKKVEDLPGGAGDLFRDPLGGADRAGHRFTFEKRGEGRLKGVDAFRDLVHEAPGQAPRRIFEGYAIGASCLALPSGRRVLTFHAADPARVRQAGEGQRPAMGIFDVHVLVSDDGGATWADTGARLAVPAAPSGTNYGAVEPHVLPLRDGRLSMLIRTQVGRFYESFSSDEGETWTPLAVTPLISSDSPAERVRLPDGRVVLFLNGCQHWDDPHGYAHGGRHVLHAAISGDDGQTWRGFREVFRARHADYASGDHGTAYPKAVATLDGQVLVGTGQAKENLAVLQIDPAWLEATTHRDDFSAGLDGWHVGPGGATLTDVGGKPALALGGAVGGGSADAVWNFPAGREGTVTLTVTPGADWSGGTALLSDHFSPPGDTRAEAGALAVLQLPGRAAIAPGQRHALRIAWDAARVTVSIDGRPAGTAALRRPDTLGASYLRLRVPGGGEASLLVHAVEAEVRSP